MGRRSGNATPISFFSFQDIITTVTGILILITLLLALEIVNPLVSEPTPDPRSGDPQQIATAIAAREVENRQLQSRLSAISEAMSVLGQASPTTQAMQTMDLADAKTAFERLLATRSHQLALAERAASASAEKLKAAGANRAEVEARLRQAEATLAEVSKLGNTRLLPGPSTKKPIVVEAHKDGITLGEIGLDGEVTVLTRSTARDARDTLTRVRRRFDSSTHYFVVYVRADAATLGSQLVNDLRLSPFDVGWDLLGAEQHIFGEDK